MANPPATTETTCACRPRHLNVPTRHADQSANQNGTKQAGPKRFVAGALDQAVLSPSVVVSRQGYHTPPRLNATGLNVFSPVYVLTGQKKVVVDFCKEFSCHPL